MKIHSSMRQQIKPNGFAKNDDHKINFLKKNRKQIEAEIIFGHLQNQVLLRGHNPLLLCLHSFLVSLKHSSPILSCSRGEEEGSLYRPKQAGNDNIEQKRGPMADRISSHYFHHIQHDGLEIVQQKSIRPDFSKLQLKGSPSTSFRKRITFNTDLDHMIKYQRPSNKRGEHIKADDDQSRSREGRVSNNPNRPSFDPVSTELRSFFVSVSFCFSFFFL